MRQSSSTITLDVLEPGRPRNNQDALRYCPRLSTDTQTRVHSGEGTSRRRGRKRTTRSEETNGREYQGPSRTREPRAPPTRKVVKEPSARRNSMEPSKIRSQHSERRSNPHRPVREKAVETLHPAIRTRGRGIIPLLRCRQVGQTAAKDKVATSPARCRHLGDARHSRVRRTGLMNSDC